MFETSHIIFAALMPFVLPAVLACLEVYCGRGQRLRWSPVVGVAAAWVACYAFALRWPSLPPRQSVDWLAPAGAALAGLALLDTWRPLRPGGRGVAVAVALIAMTGLLVRPLLNPERGLAVEGWSILAAGVVLGVAWWAAADVLAARGDARTVLGAWSLTALAVAMLMMLNGSQKLGLIAAALAAAVTALALVAAARPHATLNRAALPLVTVLLVGVLVSSRAWIVPPPPLWQVGLVFLAPLLPLGVAFSPLRDRSPGRKALLSLLLTALPLLVAVVTAVIRFLRAADV